MSGTTTRPATALARGLAALAAFVSALAIAQLPATQTLPPADWLAIRSVVEDQRAALSTGDARRAFAYASPGVRERFGDAATFLAMVRRSYSPLVEARDAQLLDGAVVDGRVIQPLQLVMPDDTVLVALYTMERLRGGAWRVAACLIAPSTLRAT